MKRLESRIAFVTGAGHGIGRATASRFASEGATIVLADIDTEAVQDVAETIRATGATCIVEECDVTNRDSVTKSFERVRQQFSRIDILVNTAGGAARQPSFDQATDADWNVDLDLNLMSVMRCIQAALPQLRESPYASVVSIGSVNGVAAFGGYSYSAAKAGLELITRNLAADFGHEGIRFNLVAPGTIRTRVWEHQPGSVARLAKLYPLGRIGEPEDIAAAVAFLASDDAAWITGITLPVEGGVLTGPNGVLPRNR